MACCYELLWRNSMKRKWKIQILVLVPLLMAVAALVTLRPANVRAADGDY
jgi:hypothetical protein